MFEVTAFNWVYWFKSGELFLITCAVIVIPVIVIYAIKTNKFLSKKILVPFIVLVSIIFFSHSYTRLLDEINKFESSKEVLFGRLCGLDIERYSYILCIDDHIYMSDGASRGLRSDAISNFSWMDKPKGCIEIEYLNYGEIPAKNGYRAYTEVVIGRLKEVSCK